MVSEEGNREVVSETREGKGLAAKDSLLEEAEELVRRQSPWVNLMMILFQVLSRMI